VKEKNRNDYIEEEDFELPNTQSNIKPSNKMENILANKDYVLHVDEKLKGLFPQHKIPHQVRYFNNPRSIPDSNGQPQLIISAHSNPELVSLSEEPDNFVVVVGKAGRGLRNNNNTLVIEEEEIPGLIKRLKGEEDEEDELGMRNL
jgi:hypothetical protein